MTRGAGKELVPQELRCVGHMFAVAALGTGAPAGVAHGGFEQRFLHCKMLIPQMQNFDFLLLFNREYVGFPKKYPEVLQAISSAQKSSLGVPRSNPLGSRIWSNTLHSGYADNTTNPKPVLSPLNPTPTVLRVVCEFALSLFF